jgi:rhodanese-related sulfurtransferase
VAIDEISVAELRALGPDVTLIDVREHDEWVDGHIAYARHVPLATVPGRLDEFDGSPTYVMCKVGGRSYRACEFAQAQGRDVVNVTGGMLAWAEAGFDVISGSDSTDA